MTLTPAQKPQARPGEPTAPSKQPPAQPIAQVIDGTRRHEGAERDVAAPADAGNDVEAASEAQKAEAPQDASGWARTASAPINDLRDLDRQGPRLVPGTPHPDRFLAERGWEVGRHGTYTRTGRRQAERGLEAG